MAATLKFVRLCQYLAVAVLPTMAFGMRAHSTSLAFVGSRPPLGLAATQALPCTRSRRGAFASARRLGAASSSKMVLASSEGEESTVVVEGPFQVHAFLTLVEWKWFFVVW